MSRRRDRCDATSVRGGTCGKRPTHTRTVNVHSDDYVRNGSENGNAGTAVGSGQTYRGVDTRPSCSITFSSASARVRGIQRLSLIPPVSEVSAETPGRGRIQTPVTRPSCPGARENADVRIRRLDGLRSRERINRCCGAVSRSRYKSLLPRGCLRSQTSVRVRRREFNDETHLRGHYFSLTPRGPPCRKKTSSVGTSKQI